MYRFDRDRDGCINFGEFSLALECEEKHLQREVSRRTPLDYGLIHVHQEYAFMTNTLEALREMFSAMIAFVNDY
jgi:hypothetical protein